MLLPTMIFVMLALLLLIINYKKGLHIVGVMTGLRQLYKVLPVILVAFVLAGMIEVIIPEEFVQQWLAREAGIRGVFLGTAGGMLLAMGPYASFPIIASIYGAGAGLGTTVSLIFAWCLLSFSRLPYELGFFGPRFTIFRMSLGIPFCILVGIFSHIFELMTI